VCNIKLKVGGTAVKKILVGILITFLLAAAVLSFAGCGNKTVNANIVGVDYSFPLDALMSGNIEEEDIQYNGFVTVETEKGEQIEIAWPEEAFLEMTGGWGNVLSGEKIPVEITKDNKTNEWVIVKVIEQP
jgi:hypothetical protein